MVGTPALMQYYLSVACITVADPGKTGSQSLAVRGATGRLTPADMSIVSGA
jgi:hypothetical protein